MCIKKNIFIKKEKDYFIQIMLYYCRQYFSFISLFFFNIFSLNMQKYFLISNDKLHIIFLITYAKNKI